jgi:hypothetical protein
MRLAGGMGVLRWGRGAHRAITELAVSGEQPTNRRQHGQVVGATGTARQMLRRHAVLRAMAVGRELSRAWYARNAYAHGMQARALLLGAGSRQA